MHKIKPGATGYETRETEMNGNGKKKLKVTVGHGTRIVTQMEAERVWIEKSGMCRTLRATGTDDYNGEANIPLRLLDSVKITW